MIGTIGVFPKGAAFVNGPQIDARGERVVVSWFTAANNDERVNVAFSSDSGANFSPPLRIDARKPSGRVDVLWLDEKIAVVAWLEGMGEGAYLEREDNGNKPLGRIPAGTYDGDVNNSPKFNRDLIEVLNVPSRTRILIHVGNKPSNSEGCILIGTARETINQISRLINSCNTSPTSRPLTQKSNRQNQRRSRFDIQDPTPWE